MSFAFLFCITRLPLIRRDGMKDINLEYYLREIRNFPLLDEEQEKELLAQAKKGDGKARARLVTSNLRLVVSIAKRYNNCGIPFSDLVAEGNVGLIYAIDKFDAAKGCRLSTYATCWIKHAICHAINEKRSLVRIPVYMNKILYRCKEKSTEILRKSGHAPSDEEGVDGLGHRASQEKIIHEAISVSRAMERVQSIQGNDRNYEYLEDIKQKQEYETLLDQSEVEWVMNLLTGLESKRCEVIKLRFGLGGAPKMTLKEIAGALNLTKERIRQIEKETLALLRKLLEKKEEICTLEEKNLETEKRNSR